MKKLFAVLLASVLLLTTVFTVSADTSSVLPGLVDQASTILFDTSNVTLTAQASFTYDGTWFKTLNASYKQDGDKSELIWMLDTPQDDGSTSTGGYTVVGIGENAWSNDTCFGNYYEEVSTNRSTTLLTRTAKLDSAVSLLKSGLGVAESLLADGITVTDTAAGQTISFSIGTLPDFVNDLAFHLASDYLQERLYTGPFAGYATGNVSVMYEDWFALMEKYYQELFGTEMPQDIVDEESEANYNAAYDAVCALVNDICAAYTDGYIDLFADGTYQWYASEEDYIRATGRYIMYYDDYFTSLLPYAEEYFGQALTEEELYILLYSPNEALTDVYSGFVDSFYQANIEKGLAIDPDAVEFVVHDDGTIEARDTVYDYTNNTVARRILNYTTGAALQSLVADIALDAEGRLTGVTGTAVIDLTDSQGTVHALEISLTLTVSDYGTTALADTFDPAQYGLVSFEEYMAAVDETAYEDEYFDWDAFLATAPETITLGGITYETLLSQYLEVEGDDWDDQQWAEDEWGSDEWDSDEWAEELPAEEYEG